MRLWLVLLPLLGLAAAARAESPSPRVEKVWSRAAAEGRVGVLYLTVTDEGQPDRLVGVATPVAAKAELHESLSENGVMKMRPVESIEIGSGQTLALKPGGYHVMLLGLRQALKEGDSFPVTVQFAKAGAVAATAHVAKAGAAAPDDHAGMGRDHGAMQH